MDKLLKYLFITCLLSAKIQAQQNLIPNPSFEIHDTCPNQQAQVNYALPWFDPTKNSSDYFNACCTNGIAGVPNNISGIKNAYDGNAYCGFSTGTLSSNYREYICVELSDYLIKGNKYCFESYLSPSGSYQAFSNNIGILALADTVGLFNFFYVNITIPPDTFTSVIYNDTASWKLLTLSFTAKQNAKYLIIGNFLTDAQTQYQVFNNNNSNQGAYYYIDKVSLFECDNFNSLDTSIAIPNIITANNDNINDSYFIKNLQPNTQIFIYNRWGSLIYSEKDYKNNWKPDESAGTYYYIIKTASKTYKGFLEIIK